MAKECDRCRRRSVVTDRAGRRYCPGHARKNVAVIERARPAHGSDATGALVTGIAFGLFLTAVAAMYLVVEVGLDVVPHGPPPDLVVRVHDATITVVRVDEGLWWSDVDVTGCSDVPDGAMTPGDQVTGCRGKVTIRHKATRGIMYRATLG